MAATNRPDLIDPALLRPGRFDRLVFVGAPDRSSRAKIFEIHMKGMPLAEDVNIDELADITEGYVGSDIAALCREAAMLALREKRNSKQVEMHHFRGVLKKVKPTIDETITDYYERVREKFKGGTPLEARSYIGYR
jgi:transitional endoplasmic reticulum ATPase